MGEPIRDGNGDVIISEHTTNTPANIGIIDFSGRFYCNTDNAWITQSNLYGLASQNHNTDAGTGATPVIPADVLGAMVSSGDRLRQLAYRGVANDAEVTGFSYAIVFEASDGTQTVLKTGTGYTLSTTEPNDSMGFIDLGDLVAPENGTVFLALKPTGTITAQRYAYMSVQLRIGAKLSA